MVTAPGQGEPPPVWVVDDVWLPPRAGPRPETTEAPAGTLIAHQQVTQNAPRALQDELFARAARLPHVTVGPSRISVPGARAFFLRPDLVRAPLSYGSEFAHLHPPYDGSLHVNLPRGAIARVETAGWGEVHPRDPGAVMLYGPRDAGELEAVWRLLGASYRYALGEPHA